MYFVLLSDLPNQCTISDMDFVEFPDLTVNVTVRGDDTGCVGMNPTPTTIPGSTVTTSGGKAIAGSELEIETGMPVSGAAASS
jgi:hypothetical protein